MALLGAKDLIDPKDIQAQIKALRDQEKRYKSAKDGFLRGRTINQAETDAENCMKKAEEDAAKVKEEVLLLKNKAKDILAEAEQAKANSEGKESILLKREADALKNEAALTKREDKLVNIEADLKRRIAKADEREAEYKTRLIEIDKVLQGLVNG